MSYYLLFKKLYLSLHMQQKQKIVVVVNGKTKRERDGVVDLIKKTLSLKKIKAEFEHVYRA